MNPLDKKALSERDICTKFITPALKKAGWNDWQFYEEFTLGRIMVHGQSATRDKNRDRADFILFYQNNYPLAIIEVKNNNETMQHGMQQALRYAKMFDVPFAYSSNGDGFVEHDFTQSGGALERIIGLDEFPSPDELHARYQAWKNLTPAQAQIVNQPYFVGDKAPRYYQQVAINRTVEAVARGQNRVLLVMATGTGKTYTAFQIMWRLWKAKQKKRILFLADRNILIDQAKNNDFKHFGGVMTKVTDRLVDKSYEIYLALYQAVSGTEEAMNIYKQFSPTFFDLIFIDECHRGSAKEDAAWRAVLEYFSTATQVGLTATPKETAEVSNIDYFGEPLYTYSLKQGIDDGFLAPYKVIRIGLDRDIEGWRPRLGQKDAYGQDIPDQVYYGPDFNKTVVLDERTELVASLITEYLKNTNRMQKTIVFCRDIRHAEAMRYALINLNGDLYSQNYKYIMQITGDNKDGKQELDNFIDPNEPYPTIVTTSKLLTTGVDAQTVQLIVLDTAINSMTEFKQIIGRGTRVVEKKNKLYFTIMDFGQASRLFSDPLFDGDPVQVYEPTPRDGINPPPVTEGKPKETNPQPKYHVTEKVGVGVTSIQELSLGEDGQLITKSLQVVPREVLTAQYPTLESFLTVWFESERKEAIVAELLGHGVSLADLAAEVGRSDLDPFDLICHVAFDRKPLTRSERARQARQKPAYFEKYNEVARRVLEALVARFADDGYVTFDKALDKRELSNFLSLPIFQEIGRPLEIVKAFGDKATFFTAMHELHDLIYQD